MIEMGRIVGSWGLLGWVKVALYGDSPAVLAASPAWQVGGREYRIEATREHSGTLVAKLAGVSSREAAQALKSATVSLAREALPDPGAGWIYQADLAGLAVVNLQGVALGTIERVFSNGAHEVMELSGAGSRLLPWVDTVVKQVDLEARRVEVDWQADW